MQLPNELKEAGWNIKESKLFKIFKFPNFIEAFSFMTKMAFISEKMDHHPNWLNVYNTVEVTLFTHSEGKITEKDIEWAKQSN